MLIPLAGIDASPARRMKMPGFASVAKTHGTCTPVEGYAINTSSSKGADMGGNQKVLKAIKETISDYASKSPVQLVSALRDPAHVAKLRKLGVDDVQIHRVILYLQQHRPEPKVFEAYLKSVRV
jgi:hypothetical protein